MEKLLAVAVVLAILALGFAVTQLRASERARRSSETLGRRVENLTNRLADLDEERRAMETVLSSMEEGVLLVSPVGGVRLINAAAERHLGTRPATLSGLTPLGLQAIIRGAAADGQTHSLELETGAPSRWLRASAIPVGDGSVLLVVRDVTEARRTESIRRDFVANASHELKTPAASIRAAAETLRTSARDDPAAVPRFAEQLEREAIRLSRIVSDLLDLSRLEGGSDLDEEVALDALLREEAERFQRAAAESGIRLSIRSEAVGRVRGSPRDLSLLIRNLVDNAIRYTRPGGAVEVSVGSENGLVVLSVEDTGIGIPSRDLPRIFERFYRVDRARSRETGGTGLGLSIVKHVVENHGGTVHVRSELGRGTTFVVRLPVLRSE